MRIVTGACAPDGVRVTRWDEWRGRIAHWRRRAATARGVVVAPTSWTRVAVEAQLGENPRLDPATGSLWWIDIPAGVLHRYRWSDAQCLAWTVADEIGAMVLGADGRPLLAIGNSLQWFDAATARLTMCAMIDAIDATRCRCNDAAWAPDGSLWLGTMDRRGAQPLGAVVRATFTGNTVQAGVIATDFTITNGPCLDARGGRMLVADSPARVIYAMACAPPSPRALFARLGADEGVPDGMCMDARGRVWVAHYGGACLSVWHADGRRLATVPLDGVCPTAVAIVQEDATSLTVAVTLARTDTGATGGLGVAIVAQAMIAE